METVEDLTATLPELGICLATNASLLVKQCAFVLEAQNIVIVAPSRLGVGMELMESGATVVLCTGEPIP